MTPVVTGYIGIAALLIILISEMPIGYSMALIGFLGFLYINGFEPALGLLKQVPYEFFSSYNLSVVPLFLLMGSFALTAGLNEKLYRIVYKWLGHFRGGLAMATVGGCAGFAAVSGSSVATAATMGTVALPEMRRYNYSPALATGSIAAGGTIGILIPPSVGFIIYGIITEQSIGKLFLAGFIPGVLEAVFYMTTISILTRRNPLMGPRGPSTSFMEKIASFKNTWVVLLLFLLIMGGLYFGIFTPTEAGGIGAFGAFVFALALRKLNWQVFKSSLVDSAKTTAMIFLILMGAMILGYFLSVSRIPFELSSIIGGLEVNRYIILVGILILLLFLGCVMDSLAILLLTIPIFFPLIISLGFDGIWFGVIVVRVCEIGLITPPVGVNVYVIKGIAKDVPMGTIFRGILPFLIADICHVTLLIVVPQLSLFLPGMMK